MKMAQDAGYPVELNLNGLKVEYAHTRPYRGMKLEDIEILHALHEWKIERIILRQSDYWNLSSGNWNRKKTRWQIETSIIVLFRAEEKLLLWEIKQQVDSVNVGDSVRPYLKRICWKVFTVTTDGVLIIGREIR